jgi:hypothetical protein
MNRIGVNLKNKSLFVSRIVNYCKTSNKDFSMKINNKKRTETIIKKKLNKLSINKLSKQSKFCKRKPKKITPKELLVGFFMMAFSSEKKFYKSGDYSLQTFQYI